MAVRVQFGIKAVLWGVFISVISGVFVLMVSEYFANKRMQETAVGLQGMYGALAPDSPWAIEEGRWQYGWMWSLAETIYAGSSEIQRNIIAERVLGLPRGR